MTSPRTRRLAVLASGRGSNFEALAAAAARGELGGTIAVLVSDRADCGAVGLARARGIDVETPDPGRPRTRLEPAAERDWVARLKARDVDTVLLAGFMRILHDDFLAAFPGRVLNLHPSLLPAFPGVDAIRRAFEHGARVTGCTVHVVDAGIDEGPILAQAAVAIKDDDTLETLSARVHAAEHALYPATVRRFLAAPPGFAGRRAVWGDA